MYLFRNADHGDLMAGGVTTAMLGGGVNQKVQS